ncbi:hypothetical protein H6G06_26515 [Anabaena sphaerica FACHB-251]|uniref:Uncharacterized protein n=1 Tax=Anabaena sphaerica FACHB-251 TaxID=2692883 RepID=A0A927A258_9NOST|nr:hypothetical protein [Anabaena sphaerica]MBD2296932.1 hypothetical protein [Anabaena sphaerica FACHB-251]
MKNTKFRHIHAVSSALFFALTILNQQVAYAQRTVSLTQMKCLTTSAEPGVDAWVTGGADVSIGQEVFTSVATLRSGWEFMGSNYIPRHIPASVACRIIPAGSKPRFRTLRLAFGLNNGNSYTKDDTLVRLTVILDGNTVETKEIAKGEQGFLLLDVTNIRSVALKAECIAGRTCPSIVFVQTLLEEAPSSPGSRR